MFIVLNGTWSRKIKCSEILKYGRAEDTVKLPSETADRKDHNRKQGVGKFKVIVLRSG